MEVWWQIEPHLRPALTLITHGDAISELRLQITELGLLESVKIIEGLHGDSVHEELKKYKFILVPSLISEPFGNVGNEGIAAGLIPIVSDAGGIVEAVGDIGYKVAPGDHEAWKSCILDLAADPNLSLDHELANMHLAKLAPKQVALRVLSLLT